MNTIENHYSAFLGTRLIAQGSQAQVLEGVKRHIDAGGDERVLIFEDWTGRQVDFDFRGTLGEVLARYIQEPTRGRPKLGVVSREISLLPRHWEWLEKQSGGISAAIRRLVDDARKADEGETEKRIRIESAGKIMWVLGGNAENFEEASRALYARDWNRFKELTANWAVDLREYLNRVLGI